MSYLLLVLGNLLTFCGLRGYALFEKVSILSFTFNLENENNIYYFWNINNKEVNSCLHQHMQKIETWGEDMGKGGVRIRHWWGKLRHRRRGASMRPYQPWYSGSRGKGEGRRREGKGESADRPRGEHDHRHSENGEETGPTKAKCTSPWVEGKVGCGPDVPVALFFFP